MMSVWLNYPRQVQLLSRILSCNFSSLASCSSLKPSYLKCDISRVLPTKIELVDQGKQIGRVGSSHAVPFVFPRYFDHQRVTCQATEVINISGSDGSSKPSQPKGKPSTEQLETIYLKLSEDIPQLFVTTQDFRIYDPNMVFEDNIRNKVIVGVQNYAMNISMLKIKSTLKYSHTKMHVLRATQHPEEGTVKMRWRIVGAPGFFKIFSGFWKFKLFSIYKTRTLSEDNSEWVDGFSIFYVNDQGKITRHVCEKMMPDDDKVVDAKKSKINVVI